VAELVDALDSKSSSARSAGSIPARGTNIDGVSELATRMNLNSLALVSVYDTSTLWIRLGFKIIAPCAGMTDKLASYGEAARYMIRDLS
jgi:hypothetical protein